MDKLPRHMGRSGGPMQIHTFGCTTNRQQPGLYLMYPMQLVTISSSICVPCFGCLRLVVNSVEDKMRKKVTNIWMSEQARDFLRKLPRWILASNYFFTIRVILWVYNILLEVSYDVTVPKNFKVVIHFRAHLAFFFNCVQGWRKFGPYIRLYVTEATYTIGATHKGINHTYTLSLRSVLLKV